MAEITKRGYYMNEIIAYCGLFCHTCPIYLATREPNKIEQNRMRIEIIRRCKEQYGIEYKLEDITDCDGCITDSERLFIASKKCPVRNCAKQKGLINCAYCGDYVCETLNKFFRTDPDAKKRLDEIRNNI
jgi:hypothetical protein